ncbi:MAG: hypothetical protein ACTSVZ_01720 [Promethearchaeota archaeon]
MSFMRRRMQSSKSGLIFTILLYSILLAAFTLTLIIPTIPDIKDGTVDSEVFIGGLVILLIGAQLFQSCINLKNMIQSEKQMAQKDSNPDHEDELRERIKLEEGY